MLALRLIIVLVIAASAGVIVLGEMKLKPLLDEMKEKEKKVTEDLGKEKAERAKQEARAKLAGDERDALKNDLDQSKKSEADAIKAAEAEKQKAIAAAQETNKAKQETAAIKVQSVEYFDLQKLGLTPPVIRNIHAALPKATNELSTLKSEQRVLMTQHIKATGELQSFLNPKGAVALPSLSGKVTAVDPKWDFVILDMGANHGLLKNGELSISREGKLVARVKVSRVETDYSIANVMTGFKKSEIKEGDAVLTPSSVVLPPQK
ncbi:MAG: hypothetical protein HZA92_01295 [Verrucomicrobia bacterium]|nr:hypothetical protein [Verrucomicrobiota bacterium]